MPLPAASRQLFERPRPAPANWPERMSVPITRIVCGLTARNGLPCSVFPMSMSFDFWICDEISKARKLIRIHASAAIPTHFRTRRHSGRVPGGDFSLPFWPRGRGRGPCALSVRGASRGRARAGD